MLSKIYFNCIHMVILHIVYSFCLINCYAHEIGTLYEGQLCTDSQTQKNGCCRKLETCPSAIEDLKNKKIPMLCSFKENATIVCCEDMCSDDQTTERPFIWDFFLPDSEINPFINNTSEDRYNTPLRISEEKCLEYSQPIVNNRKRRSENGSQQFQKNNNSLELELLPSVTNATWSAPPSPDMAVGAVGGENSLLYEFPHMAALGWYTINGNIVFSCGGSLISEKYILTAGHCTGRATGSNFNQSEPSIVRLGDLNIIDSIYDSASPIDIPIERIIKHPKYKPPNKYYDIALVELKDRIERSYQVRPACIWTRDDFGVHKSAIVTGWGTTVSGGTENSPILQKVTLDIIDSVSCDNLLKHLYNRHWQGIRDHQMCAGVLIGGKDACQGDSGGPLQVEFFNPRIQTFAVIGVTSFGRQCAKPNQPGIYTRVSAFIDWIESIVWPKNNVA